MFVINPYVLQAGSPFILTETLGSLRSDFTGCVGYKFTVGASDIIVDQLGRRKVAGNSQTHTIRIMDASTSIVSASVDMSTGSAGSYVYTSITPTTLLANTVYYIFSSETSGGDQWYDSDGTIDSTAAFATQGGAYYQNTCNSVERNAGPGSPQAYGRPNFTAR